MNRTWGKRSAPLVLLTAGFLTLGSGVASADITVGPVSLPADGVNLKVAPSDTSTTLGGQSGATSQGGQSSTAKQPSAAAPGGSAGVPRTQAVQQPAQQEGGGLLSNNDASVNVNPSIDVSCNDITILSSSSSNCGGGAVPPSEEEPPGDGEGNNPPDDGGAVPPPDEPPMQPRVTPDEDTGGAEVQEAAEQLPFTGTNTGTLAGLALGLLAAGAACVTATSRRFRWNRG